LKSLEFVLAGMRAGERLRGIASDGEPINADWDELLFEESLVEFDERLEADEADEDDV
jgi:hypothetical protein